MNAPLVGLTLRLAGAVTRKAEGTNTGYKNAKGIASVGVRVEPTVRLLADASHFGVTLRFLHRAT